MEKRRKMLNNLHIISLLVGVLTLSSCGLVQESARELGVSESIIQTSTETGNNICELRKISKAASFDAGDTIDLICSLSNTPNMATVENNIERDQACWKTRRFNQSDEWVKVCGQRDLGKFH